MTTNSYAKQQAIALETATPSQTLAWGLTTTARKLAIAKDGPFSKDSFLEAVRLNWRLWTIIQTEQADPDCQTPLGVREGLLNLANFVDKRTIAILASPEPEMVDVLIDINRNIAAGLLGVDLAPEERAERERRDHAEARSRAG